MSPAEVRSEWIERQLDAVKPTRPLPELVEELNRIYHACEARDYDRKHTEIFTQLPPLWAEMMDTTLRALPDGPLRILDFGCGTGFEATQLLDGLPPSRIASMVCYDLSADMLARCGAAVKPRFPSIRLTSNWEEVAAAKEQFNLVASNSVLHHVPDLGATMGRVGALAAAGAVWIAGHEPSSRYYRNAACASTLEKFRRERRWRRFVDAGRYWNRARQALGLLSSPAETTAKRAVEAKLFEHPPSAALVSRLVDFCVAHDASEAAAGRGLDFEELANQLRGQWELLYVRTYSFMGPFYEARLPRRWQTICRRLAQDHPKDGSNVCTIWRKA